MMVTIITTDLIITIIMILHLPSMTGIVYDERMKTHRNDNNPNHPECPERISSIWEQLIDDGVVECCRRINARSATEQEILYVHR